MKASLPCLLIFKEIYIPLAADTLRGCVAKAEVHPFNTQVPNPPTISINFMPSPKLQEEILQELKQESMKCFIPASK
jgi:hypothetical protein